MGGAFIRAVPKEEPEPLQAMTENRRHLRSPPRPSPLTRSALCVVDFHLSRKYPAEGHARHPWRPRTFWPVWFSTDNVHPSPDHVPYLHRRLELAHFAEARGKVPYMSFVGAPYYQFIGDKKA